VPAESGQVSGLESEEGERIEKEGEVGDRGVPSALKFIRGRRGRETTKGKVVEKQSSDRKLPLLRILENKSPQRGKGPKRDDS